MPFGDPGDLSHERLVQPFCVNRTRALVLTQSAYVAGVIGPYPERQPSPKSEGCYYFAAKLHRIGFSGAGSSRSI